MEAVKLRGFNRRSLERKEEDRNAISVIITRNDTSLRHPDDILEKAIREGVEQYKQSRLSLLISAISAGLIVGFSAMAVCFAHELVPSEWGTIPQKFVMALFYPFGFMLCVLSGAQLFTEDTALFFYPVLDRKIGWAKLTRAWIIVLVGNLIGTFGSACFIYYTEPIMQGGQGYVAIAMDLLDESFFPLFMGSILAGWLMALGGWLVLATSETISQLFCIYLATFTIGIGSFQHSIVGSAELFLGLFISEDVLLVDIIKFLSVAVPGNLIGGSVMVATLNYLHIRKTKETKIGGRV